MARISLGTVWINAQDANGFWSDAIELLSTSGLQQDESSNMRVRSATGDRSVVTILPGGENTWQLDCKLAMASEVAWLRAHRKQLLCFRDMHGERIFGVYPKVTRTPYTDGEHFTVSLAITQIDYTGA